MASRATCRVFDFAPQLGHRRRRRRRRRRRGFLLLLQASVSAGLCVRTMPAAFAEQKQPRVHRQRGL